MTIVVTGATGPFGRHTIEALLRRGVPADQIRATYHGLGGEEDTAQRYREQVEQFRDLGIGDFFFESREPPADEYSIADLEADFPEGEYRISGIGVDDTPRVGTALFTHDIPAPPKIRYAANARPPAPKIARVWRRCILRS